MKYRKFGKLNWEASALGFGIMRLPVINNDYGKINEQESMEMVRYAIDNGVNYIDTAWMYHDDQSESFVGRVLENGYREKVKVATKLPSWLVEKPSDFDRFFDEQRQRLQTESVDFYLLHSLKKDYWDKINGMGVLQWAEKQMAKGRIKNIGFSFHDSFDVFKEIVDAYDNWTMCQIQYNYMDTDYQAGTKGLKYAADKGLAVVVMEPLRGGQLTRKPPEPVADLLNNAPEKRSQADWGLQWIWNHPEATVVLSGMSNMDHVRENIISADKARAGSLTDEELNIIGKIHDEYSKLCPIPCTACKYCLPCPEGVNIPGNFEFYNDAFMYDDLEGTREAYFEFMKTTERADQCAECGECEEKCPQEIEIMTWLKKTKSLFSSGSQQ
ncbi:MAG: aldo/keto reductase [Desulfobacterales bacterium]|nr:aldo/keto reductase [Desulfobacterales bacterium]